MTLRKQRISRLVELRDKALKDEVAELGKSQALERAAEDAEQKCRELLRVAQEARRELVRVGAAVMEFMAAEEWLSKKQFDCEIALQKLTQARIHRGRIQLRVKAARTKMRQAEKLVERLARHEHVAAIRAERKMEDEFLNRGFIFNKRNG